MKLKRKLRSIIIKSIRITLHIIIVNKLNRILIVRILRLKESYINKKIVTI